MGEHSEELSCAKLCRADWRASQCAHRRAPVPASAAAGDAPLPGSLFPLWREFEDAFREAGGLEVVSAPGTRGFGGGPDADWVARGERMSAEDVLTARTQWLSFMARAPAYPAEKFFSGRGIVTTGGGLRYMVPTLVSVYMIRRTGCTLPVEVWFFENELPGPAAAAELRAMGVRVRSIDEMRLDASREVFKYGARGFGYVMKAAVVLFSSFEEVIYLDSDNVPLRDLSDLFELPAYRETGAILWPDYWAPSMAPDLFLIAPEAAPGPNSTCESGQAVFHKRQTWRALLLTLFLNCQGVLYYNLMTNYLGMGDKESFPLAMRMLKQPYHSVGEAYPVGSVGLEGAPRVLGGPPALQSTTMVQYHPATGLPLLFHSNLNKFSLNVPVLWGHYERRWQVVTPPRWRFQAHKAEDPPLRPLRGGRELGLDYDPERAVWDFLVSLHCTPWLEAYLLGVGSPAQVERVFDSHRMPYNSFLLDEHMTGRYQKIWRVGEKRDDAAGGAGGVGGGAAPIRPGTTQANAVEEAELQAALQMAAGPRTFL